MINIIKNDYFLIFVLLLSISITWLFDIKNQKYTKVINPSSVMALDTIIAFIFFTIILFITKKHLNLYQDIYKLNVYDYSYFLILGFVSIIIGFIWIEILKFHKLSKIKSYDYLIDILVTVVAFSFIMKGEFTWKKMIGVILFMIGMYLIN